MNASRKVKKIESQANRLQNTRKYTYEVSRRGKSRETESRLMVSRSLGQARGRRDGYWTGVWEGTENLLAPARRDTCTTLGVS